MPGAPRSRPPRRRCKGRGRCVRAGRRRAGGRFSPPMRPAPLRAGWRGAQGSGAARLRPAAVPDSGRQLTYECRARGCPAPPRPAPPRPAPPRPAPPRPDPPVGAGIRRAGPACPCVHGGAAGPRAAGGPRGSYTGHTGRDGADGGCGCAADARRRGAAAAAASCLSRPMRAAAATFLLCNAPLASPLQIPVRMDGVGLVLDRYCAAERLAQVVHVGFIEGRARPRTPPEVDFHGSSEFPPKGALGWFGAVLAVSPLLPRPWRAKMLAAAACSAVRKAACVHVPPPPWNQQIVITPAYKGKAACVHVPPPPPPAERARGRQYLILQARHDPLPPRCRRGGERRHLNTQPHRIGLQRPRDLFLSRGMRLPAAVRWPSHSRVNCSRARIIRRGVCVHPPPGRRSRRYEARGCS